VLAALVEFALEALHAGGEGDALCERFVELARAAMRMRSKAASSAAAAAERSAMSGDGAHSPTAARERDHLLAGAGNGTGHAELGSPANVLATACVRLFVRSLNASAYRTHALYELLLSFAGEDALEADARITVLRLLVRLRADANFAV
jgi:hypothetical protein